MLNLAVRKETARLLKVVTHIPYKMQSLKMITATENVSCHANGRINLQKCQMLKVQ
jgi:hypothetical protein